MAWTETKQCNKALALIGSSTITDIDATGDPTATMLAGIFDSIRDGVLEVEEWPFAIKRVALTQVDDWLTATAYEVDDIVFTDSKVYTCLVAHTSGTFADDLASLYWSETYIGPSFKYTECYLKPSDCLKPLEMSDEDADWAEEGDLIVSDTSRLELKYIKQVTDATKWSIPFIEAFAAKIAAEIAFVMTQSKETMEAMQKLYGIKVEEASSSESQVGKPPEPRQDYWEEGRYTDD